VRTPSRFDTDLVNPGVLNGNPDFRSEDLIAYEAGYRGLLSSALSVSVSAFYNSYEQLRTVEASGPAVFPLVIRNNMEGDTYGAEAWGDLSVRSWWRVSAGVNTLHENLRLSAGSRDVFGVSFAGNDPRYQCSLRSDVDLPRGFAFDAGLRRVGRLESPAVDAYLEADARLAWQVRNTLSVSIEGQNLLHAQHLEFVNVSIKPAEVPRSFTLAARWTP
jgi:iron complex outermembrane receptor protein